MESSPITVIHILLFLSGGLIVFLIMRVFMISRNAHDTLKENFFNIKNTLDKNSLLESQLNNTISDLNKKLEEEKSTNTKQKEELILQKANIENIKEKILEEKEKNSNQELQIKQHNTDINNLKNEITKNETLKSALEEKLKKKDIDFEELRKKSLIEFENIANKLFEDKSAKFSKLNKENIESILTPLKINLNEFKKKVEDTYDKESKQRFSLESKISDLEKLNKQISEDAINLTNALKGTPKLQGDWGENILETALKFVGLKKDVQYFTQKSFTNENGNLSRPDVMIKFPDEKQIIIDSKVSLVDYVKFSSALDKNEQKIYIENHVKSIKNHINNLSSKEYENFEKAADFVFLFIPIEQAYILALDYDNQLWNYAYSKRIVLISQTSLIATLKIISDVWNKESQNKNAREIARKGKKLYEKFVGFIEVMEKTESFLQKANFQFNDGMKKLYTGKDNLVRQAEVLKNLGIEPKKQISEKYLLNSEEE